MADAPVVDAFKTQFGLESNAAPAHVAPAAAVEDGAPAPAAKPAVPEAQDSIESITKAIEELGKTGDNLERLQKQREQAEAAAAAPEGAEDENKEEVAEDVAKEINAEKPDAEAAKAEGDGGDGADQIDVPTAQQYIDYLDTNFADQVQVPFTANGKTQPVTLAKLKEMAAGYSGEAAVSRKLQEANDALKTAKRIEIEGKAPKQQLDAIISTLEDPKKLVNDLIIGNYEGDVSAYLTALNEVVTAELAKINENPDGFESRRMLKGMDRRFSNIERALADRNAAPDRAAEPPAVAAAAPADFGFEAGVGYPATFKHQIARTLEVAVKTAGKPEEYTDQVIAKWTESGRKVPVTDFLISMLNAERTDAPKLKDAQKPPMRKQPENRSMPSQTAKKPTGRVAWEDIEKLVASEVRAAQKTGKV